MKAALLFSKENAMGCSRRFAVTLENMSIEGGASLERMLALTQRYLEHLQKSTEYEDLCFATQEIVEN